MSGRGAKGWLVVVGFVLASLASGDAGAAPSSEAIEAEFVADLNALRATKGLEPLPVDMRLVRKARSWAATMAAADDLWHSRLAGGNPADWRKLGENVGRGGSQSALHRAFVDSPKHHRNLVDPDWDAVGVGVVLAPGGRIYVAQEFMELRSGDVVAGERRPAPDAGGPAGASVSSPVPAPAGPRVDAAAGVMAQLHRLRTLAA